jgi:hypothetical protein
MEERGKKRIKMKPYRKSKVRVKVNASIGRLERLLISELPTSAHGFIQAARNNLNRALDIIDAEREKEIASSLRSSQ